MGELLKDKPGKKLSLFSKVSSFLFFFINYELRVVTSALFSADHEFVLPTADETLGLIYASIFLGSVFIAVDFSILIQNIKGTRN